MLKSCLYYGSTTHTRMKPSVNKFTYSVYMIYIDLEELQNGLLERWPVFSASRRYPMLSFLERDHMINESAAKLLHIRVRDVVERETGIRPRGRICLLTNARVMGVEFNPVSFYYIFEEDGDELQFVVAEVGNFPWFEQHNYVIRPAQHEDTGTDEGPGVLRRFNSHDKAFHVSPFINISDMQYDWLVSTPSQRLRVRIGLKEKKENFFLASLDVSRVEWSKWNMLRMQVMCPLHTLRVMGGILWEAAKLYWKGMTFYGHPEGTETWLSHVVERIVGIGNDVSAWVSSLRPKSTAVAR